MKKIILMALVGLWVVLPSFALDLSFDTAVDMIQKESNDIKKADANLKKAAAALKSVNSNRWLKIDASATYMNLVNVENPGSPMGITLDSGLIAMLNPLPGVAFPSFIEIPDNIGMAGVNITQPIYTFGKIGHAVDAARISIDMAKSGAEIAKREVRYAAANLYWTVKMTDGLVDIAKASLKQSQNAKKLLTEAGRANRSNLVKITADIAAKEIQLSDAEFNRDSAHRILKIMAGIDMGEELNLTDNFPDKFENINPGKLERNPEWDLYERQAKMYESRARSSRAGRYPTLAAMASYNYTAMKDDYKLWDADTSQSAYWGLSFTLPLFDGGLSRANATMDAMDAIAAREDLNKSKKLKTDEYNTAVLQYSHYLNNLSALKEARDLAKRAQDISRDRFAAGQTSAVELAEVQAALAQMDMALLDAKMKILMADENIKKLNSGE